MKQFKDQSKDTMPTLYKKKKITLGKIYEIKNSFVNQNKPKYKIFPHIAMLQFGHATSITPIIEEILSIPHYKFNFI